jgi:Septum formation
MRSLGIRLGIIGVIAAGAFILRPFLSGNAGSLSVGDCFDEPAGSSGTVEDVQHHPCTDVHSAEVVFVGNYSPATDTLPTDEAFVTFFEANCTPAFNAYTGLDFATDPTYDMSAFTPTADGWGSGDHKVICYAVRLDSGTMNASIKKA